MIRKPAAGTDDVPQADRSMDPARVEPHQRPLPLVYSCSGASSAAQMANHLAIRLDRLRVADMSCIAGLGGDVPPLLRTAQSGRPIIAIDGCRLGCVARTLARHGLSPHRHYDLGTRGVAKRPHEDFSPDQGAEVLRELLNDLRPAPTCS